jgi:hypothetical protein
MVLACAWRQAHAVAPQAKTTLEALLAQIPINGSRPRTVRNLLLKESPSKQMTR